MSAFLWSQVLITIAIVFDLISFQFKKDKKLFVAYVHPAS